MCREWWGCVLDDCIDIVGARSVRFSFTSTDPFSGVIQEWELLVGDFSGNRGYSIIRFAHRPSVLCSLDQLFEEKILFPAPEENFAVAFAPTRISGSVRPVRSEFPAPFAPSDQNYRVRSEILLYVALVLRHARRPRCLHPRRRGRRDSLTKQTHQRLGLQ